MASILQLRIACRPGRVAHSAAPGLCLWEVTYDLAAVFELLPGARLGLSGARRSLVLRSSAGAIRALRPRGRFVPTYSPKASEITRKWYVVDAEGLVLGRLATEVARVLRGKHKPTFAPHGHRRPRHRDQRRQGGAHRRQGRPEDRLPALRLPGWPQVPHVRRPMARRPSPRKPCAALGRGHAPQEPPRRARCSPSSRCTPARTIPTRRRSPRPASNSPPPGAPP